MKTIEKLAKELSCIIGELDGMKKYYGWGENKRMKKKEFMEKLDKFRKRPQGQERNI